MGGGTGFLSLLAIECGFKEVYYVDYFDQALSDAQSIASTLRYERKDYILGDIDKVIEYCRENNIAFDAVGSYDVLEHIYDLGSHISDLKEVVSDRSVVCLASGANTYNKRTYDRLADGHLRSDFLPQTFWYGHKSLAPWLDLRLEIISDYARRNDLALNELECVGMAFLTRGMMQSDVEASCVAYLANKNLPEPDPFGAYKYNTCDPLTGGWKEHLIDFEKLAAYGEDCGYDVEVCWRGEKELSTEVQFILKRGLQ